MGLKFAKVDDVKSPERAGVKEAGIDFYIPNSFEKIKLYHGESILIGLGIKVCLPKVPECLANTHEYMLKFENKSGIAYKKGLVVGSCIIDTTYQGELFLNLHNNTESVVRDGDITINEEIIISPNDKIVQGVLILVNVEEIMEVSERKLFETVSQRGSSGFGSNYKEN